MEGKNITELAKVLVKEWLTPSRVDALFKTPLEEVEAAMGDFTLEEARETLEAMAIGHALEVIESSNEDLLSKTAEPDSTLRSNWGKRYKWFIHECDLLSLYYRLACVFGSILRVREGGELEKLPAASLRAGIGRFCFLTVIDILLYLHLMILEVKARAKESPLGAHLWLINNLPNQWDREKAKTVEGLQALLRERTEKTKVLSKEIEHEGDLLSRTFSEKDQEAFAQVLGEYKGIMAEGADPIKAASKLMDAEGEMIEKLMVVLRRAENLSRRDRGRLVPLSDNLTEQEQRRLLTDELIASFRDAKDQKLLEAIRDAEPGTTQEEIGAKVGLVERQVRRRLQRIIEKLKKRRETLGDLMD